jgi:hypothetical protein
VYNNLFLKSLLSFSKKASVDLRAGCSNDQSRHTNGSEGESTQMYFPAPDDVPPSPFRTPRYTTHFPRLTSIARNLLSDEGYDLPFHFRLGHANVSSSPAYPLAKTVPFTIFSSHLIHFVVVLKR